MKKYRLSNYLNIIKLTKNYLLFNGFNGCMDEISEELGEKLEELQKNKVKQIKLINRYLEEEEKLYFVKRGYITVFSEKKEIKIFKKVIAFLDKQNIAEARKKANIMFLLSYDCNLKCDYCYQKSLRQTPNLKKIQPEFIEEFYSSIMKKLFPDITPESISITLYGGEPLLDKNYDTIKKILFHAGKNKQYIGTITNGTFSDKFLSLFGTKPGYISFAQITLDGMAEYHDSSRIGAGGQKTFSKILKNIHKLIDKGIKINIRTNVTKDNLEQISELLRFLKEQDIFDHPNVYFYTHPVHNHFNQTNNENLFNSVTYYQYLKNNNIEKTIRNPVLRRAESLSYLLDFQQGIPFKKTRFCMQNLPNCYIIDPEYDIYGCYEEAGRKGTEIGKLKNQKIIFNSIFKKNQSRSLLKMNNCLSCPIALVCGGECPVQNREINSSIFIPYCSDTKESIHLTLRVLYESRKETYVKNPFDSEYVLPHL